MGNAKQSKKPGKEMSEGMAIAVIVISVTIGGVAAYYAIKWVLSIFFPDLIS